MILKSNIESVKFVDCMDAIQAASSAVKAAERSLIINWDTKLSNWHLHDPTKVNEH